VVFTAVAVSYGAGRHITTLLTENVQRAILFTMIGSPANILSFVVPKFAVVLFLVKVCDPGRRHRAFMWAISIVYSLMSAALVVLVWVQCTPAAVQWRAAKGTCWSPRVLFAISLVHGVWSSLFDFYLAIYATIVMNRFLMNRRRKVVFSTALGFGYW
jgi:hypothetical protein